MIYNQYELVTLLSIYLAISVHAVEVEEYVFSV